MKKLVLDQLTVQSFLTLGKKEMAHLHGGYDEPTEVPVNKPGTGVGPCGDPYCLSEIC